MDSKEILSLAQLSAGENNILNGLMTSAQLASINPYVGVAHGVYTIGKNAIEYNYNRHREIKGDITSSNFTQIGRKPYGIMLVTPESNDEMVLTNYFNFWGCPSRKTDILNIDECMYNNHAYIKGILHFNKSDIPIFAFNKINNIFNKGVHILNA